MSARRAHKRNSGMQLRYNASPTCTAQDGTQCSILSSKCKAKLYWRLHRADDGAKTLCRHYRYCRPHTLQTESDLWCAFCNYNSAVWKSAGLAVMPTGEVDFIRNFMHATDTDVQYCRQVVPDWWPWPVDFWNSESNVYIQVDGHMHWYGMHGCSSSEVQKRDMAFNKKAFTNDARVVRVHTADISSTAQLAAAIESARDGCRIVLTAAYAAQLISPNSVEVRYVDALQETLGTDSAATDSHGNILIH